MVDVHVKREIFFPREKDDLVQTDLRRNAIPLIKPPNCHLSSTVVSAGTLKPQLKP